MVAYCLLHGAGTLQIVSRHQSRFLAPHLVHSVQLAFRLCVADSFIRQLQPVYYGLWSAMCCCGLPERSLQFLALAFLWCLRPQLLGEPGRDEGSIGLCSDDCTW